MPSVPLKEYQRECLEKLAAYCSEVRSQDARGAARPEREAFEAVTGRLDSYFANNAFAGVPYICLRVPTGGGKTLLGAHSVGVIARQLGHQDRPLILWVTPTITIRDQTLKTFKDSQHPNHAALVDSLGPSFQVLTLEEAQSMSRAMISADPVVVVTTIQSYRIGEAADDEIARKVYQDNGYLMDHFDNLPPWAQSFLKSGDGRVARSLANAMKLRGPIVVIDEAHNARTQTSFDSLARFGPLAVLELTATPLQEHDPDAERYASNVLHAVSALQLQKEGMIKLPVELESRADWLDVLAATIERRAAIATAASELFRRTGRFIRPIALIQAQARNRNRESHTVEAVKAKLIDPTGPFKLDPSSVVICTASIDELGDANLADVNCPIEYVVTIERLREGWDCPFAYVLGSIGNVSTETAVEQILGRVLRMPHARPTGVPELDRAYAVVQSLDVLETAQGLRDALVQTCGFDDNSAADAFRVSRVGSGQRSLLTSLIPLSVPPRMETLSAPLLAKVSYVPSDGGLRVSATLSQEEALALRSVVGNAVDQQAVEAYWQSERPAGVAVKRLDEYAVPVRVPQLAVRTASRATLFEPKELDEFSWDLDKCDPNVSEQDFDPTYRVGDRVQIDMNASGGTRIGSVESVLLSRASLFDDGEEWTEQELVRWLNGELHKGQRFQGLTATHSVAWLRRVVAYLAGERRIDLGVIVRKRHLLADILIPRVSEHGFRQVRRVAKMLIAGECAATLETTYDTAFRISEQDYSPFKTYAGGFSFKKHAFDKIGAMNSPEADCAKRIDDCAYVTRWVRNLEHESAGGFSLPLSPGRFFPDFIAELEGGRVAIIEYKGSHIASDPRQIHKKEVGELWASQSGGLARFGWVVDKDWNSLEACLTPTL